MTRSRSRFPNLTCCLARLTMLLILAAPAAAWTGSQSVQETGAQQSSAQDQTQPATDADTAIVSLDQLNARIGELEQLATRTEEQEKELTWLQQARDWVNKLQRSRQQTEKFAADAAAAPAELAEWKQKPKPTPPEKLPAKYADATAETIAPELDAARTELGLLRQARQDLTATSTHREDRLRQIPTDTATARQRIQDIGSELSAPAPADEATSVTRARKQALNAERQYLQQYLAEIEQERLNYNARRELLREKILYKEQEVVAQERLVTLLENRQNQLLQQAADEERRRAEREAAAARNAHPIIQEILARNEAYAAERAEVRQLTTEYTATRNTAAEQLSTLQDRLKADKERVEQIGLSEAIGMRLRTQKSRLPSLRVTERRIGEYEVELNRAQLRRGELEDTQLQLVDLDSALEALIARVEAELPANPDERAKLLETAREALLNQRQTHLANLIDAYDNYINTILVPLLEHETSVAVVTRDYRDFIDQRILWIQSTRPIGLGDLEGLQRSFAWMTNARTWKSLIAVLWDDFRARPIGPIVSILVVLVLLLLRPRMIGFIHRAAERAGRITTNFIGDTLTVASLTILIAATWPIALWLVAERLDDVIAAVPFAENISNGLLRLAGVLFATSLVWHVFRKNGLAESHFRWRLSTITLMRRHLRWAAPMILPLSFITGLTTGTGVEIQRNSLGRLSFILSAIVIAAFIYFLMHPRKGVPGKYIEEHHNGWMARLRWLWFPLMVLIPIGLAVTSAIGYHYTAIELRERFIWTTELLLAVVVLNALFVRWIYLTQRRMAYEQSRKRRMATLKQLREKAGRKEADDAARGEYEQKKVQLEKEDENDQTLQLDVDAISTQTRQLLRTGIMFVTIIGLALIWANVFPALSILREVELWQVTTTITADGDLQPVETQTPITLLEVAVALLILLVTIIVTRNIPGLLEIVVLQRLPFTAGGRYAIRTITQYVLGIIGIFVAFDAIGIGWSNVQFLAAAVTVGLGFGLQEIFANFVSGIIILFERPVRVGDTITVGNISGTVTRIRMRATTVVDWDRKELIIPNKEFVTGQIVNWSLSDTVLRVIIPVGVSYGGDTDLARELLLKVAKDCEKVLDDPAPRALFLGFGDSTLDFELRVFIAHPDIWLATRDELHHMILKAFREHDVEIAFPQRDLHIRSLPEGMTMMSKSEAAAT